MKLMCTLVAAAAVGLLAAGTSSSMTHPKLIGTVGPGFTITLKKAGKAVKTLKAGTYTFVVSDKASIHDFELRGPGATTGPNRMLTAVPFTGTKTVTITLRKGQYRFYCAPHASSMFGLFRVV
jgi:plastocyanin